MLELRGQVPPAIGPETLRAFAHAVRERLGLAQPGRRVDVLAHRLREAMRIAGWELDPAAFVLAFASAGDDDPISLAVADAITNQETSFFRDVRQLTAAMTDVVPEVMPGAPGEPLRILSAGCSTGEEVFSLAMLLLDQPQVLWGRRTQIVGVDVSDSALAVARSGCYRVGALARAGAGPGDWERRYFTREGERFTARGLLRSMTRFARGNIVSPRTLSGLGRFDLVVCRNVLIYFDAETLARAVETLVGLVRPGGALVLGHAECGMAASIQGWMNRSPELIWYRRPEDA
ncbi:MAG: CheR family methyltransferase [Myxococcales bacterium]|jgi:chemotaxis protein methyltransferase CheR